MAVTKRIAERTITNFWSLFLLRNIIFDNKVQTGKAASNQWTSIPYSFNRHMVWENDTTYTIPPVGLSITPPFCKPPHWGRWGFGELFFFVWAHRVRPFPLWYNHLNAPVAQFPRVGRASARLSGGRREHGEQACPFSECAE
jgi:hypothetical protein